MKRVVVALLIMSAIFMVAACKRGGVKTITELSDTTKVSAVVADTFKKGENLAPKEYLPEGVESADSFFNALFEGLDEKQLHSKELFSEEYYTLCQKVGEKSDGDIFWLLGSIQRLKRVSVEEAHFQDNAHATVEAMLEAEDMSGVMDGVEFRSLKMILKDGRWIIDDVNNSKESLRKSLEN